MKLTPWFNGSVKPVRDGVYERNYGPVRWMCKYKSGQWFFACESAKKANKEDIESCFQDLPWRGITKEQK